MDLADFKFLSKEKQYIFWLAKSVEIATCEKDGFFYVLYQLDNFYIEMQLMRSPGDVTFSAFEDEYRLTPYLEKINIDGIGLWGKV